MKKKLMAVLVLLAVMLVCVPPVQAKIKLTYASNGPEKSVRGKNERMFLDELVKASQGEIEVVAYWSDTLVSGPEILKAVQDGVADMGFINAFFFPNQLPFTNAVALAEFGPSKGRDIVALHKKLFATVPELMQEYLRVRQRPVYFFCTDNYSYVSKKPLKSIEDLKGLKARSSSRWQLSAFQSAGATPVSVPWSECYMALQTGTIDAILTSTESNHRGKLYEVAPNLWVWDRMWGSIPYLITMNEKRYQSLSPELKKVFETAGTNAEKLFAESFDRDVKDNIEDMAKAGTTVTHATDGDYAAWRALPFGRENRATWIREAEAKKIPNAEQMLEKILNTIAEADK